MPVQLDHTIVRVRDKHAAADFYSDVLGFAPATPHGPFLEIRTANGAILAFADTEGSPVPNHYAFLVGADDFDDILDRVRERELPHWADPHRRQPGAINHEYEGRGVYWEDPDGHLLEMITRSHHVAG
jgi:catechol 2,3-dioxygenase-like lactoylglutathione lyase family enzyme